MAVQGIQPNLQFPKIFLFLSSITKMLSLLGGGGHRQGRRRWSLKIYTGRNLRFKTIHTNVIIQDAEEILTFSSCIRCAADSLFLLGSPSMVVHIISFSGGLETLVNG